MTETLELDSEERAQRLHLSRFHLDRIVSAAAGEPRNLHPRLHPGVRRSAGPLASAAAVRRVIVLGALEKAGITDLDAGDPADWVSQPA